MPAGGLGSVPAHAVPIDAHATTIASIFLIPNGTFFAELVLFVVVLGVVSKFVLPPLQAAMDERARVVRDALQASDEGHSEAERLVSERREVLDRARAEARSHVEAAGIAATELYEAARSSGLAEHDAILSEARPRIDAERSNLEQALMARMGALALAAAGSVVGERIDGERHRDVIDAVVARAFSAGDAPEGR